MLDKVTKSPGEGDDRSGGALAVSGQTTDILQGYDEVLVREPQAGGSGWRLIKSSFLMLLQGVLMIALLAGSFFLTKRMIAEKPEARKRPAFKTVYTVETLIAKPADIRPVFTAYGQTVAARSVDLRALVSGEIVSVSPKLRAGARVGSGETLLEIDRFNYEGELAEAKANLSEAQARIVENEAQVALEQSKLRSAEEQLKFALDDLNRIEDLVQRGTSTQRELESRQLLVSQRQQAIDLSRDTIKVQQSRVAQIEASIERLKWRVQQAERNLASTKLVAPFTGIVRSSTAEIGRAITANDVVVSLYEADTLEVRFTLTDAQYGRLQESDLGLAGRELDVIWSVGGKEYSYPAKIDRVGAEIASNRGGVELYARLEPSQNSVAMRPGAFVEIRVPDRLFESTVFVPDTAIYDGDTAYVKVDGLLQQRTVEIAAYQGEEALVSSGINAGDEVLITRISEVSAGLAVQTEAEASAARDARSDSGAPAQGQGRPSREEVAAILSANGITMEAWQALPREEKQKLIKTHRSGNPPAGSEPQADASGSSSD